MDEYEIYSSKTLPAGRMRRNDISRCGEVGGGIIGSSWLVDRLMGYI